MPGSRRDFSDSEFIKAVTALEPASTQEIAEHVGCTRENARLRLIELHKNGEVSQKKIRGSYVWYL